jgi:hypothetical protein
MPGLFIEYPARRSDSVEEIYVTYAQLGNEATREAQNESTEELHDEAAEGSDHARESVDEPDGYFSPSPLSEGGYYVSGGAAGLPELEDISPRTSVDGPDGGFWEQQQRPQGQVRGGEKEKLGKGHKQGNRGTEEKKEGKGKERNKHNSENDQKEKGVRWKEDKKGKKEEKLKKEERLNKKEEELKMKEEKLKKKKEKLKKEEEKLRRKNKEKEEYKRKKEGKEREKGKKGEKEGKRMNKVTDEKDKKKGKNRKKRGRKVYPWPSVFCCFG